MNTGTWVVSRARTVFSPNSWLSMASGVQVAFARQASHGCVRLERPRALAEALLEGDATWTPEAIDNQLLGDKTVRARLTTQVPVFILYWTTFGGSDGQMHFRSDPYGWDRELLQRVGVLLAPPKPSSAKPTTT